ncbi:hypothetical protein PIB30_029207, partial [Stylosanthes scabra]|nr:hypothetical protein [Stylosanthes scabra]
MEGTTASVMPPPPPPPSSSLRPPRPPPAAAPSRIETDPDDGGVSWTRDAIVPTRKHAPLGTKTNTRLWEPKRSGNANRLAFSNQFQERYEVEDDDHHFRRFQARESNQNNKKQTEAETKTNSKRKWTFFDQLQSRKAK